MDGEVLLGVGADHRHKLVAVGQELVEVVVGGGVGRELADGPLAVVDILQQGVEPGDRIVEVIGEYRPDPTDEKGIFGLVDVKAVKDFPRPVTLAEAKATPALAKMSLVTSFRLSVQPVTAQEWKLVCKMGLVPGAR